MKHFIALNVEIFIRENLHSMQIQNICGKEIDSHRRFAEWNVSRPIRDRCWFYDQSQKVSVNIQPL